VAPVSQLRKPVLKPTIQPIQKEIKPMSSTASPTETTTTGMAAGPRIFFLDLSASGRTMSANPDGSDLKVVIDKGQNHPDGLVVDPVHGHLYWTNMGNPVANDGSISRSNLDGSNASVIVPPGGTFTPKQLQLESRSRKLYWCDREGMRVMRCNLDGSMIETLVQTGKGEADRKDEKRWCVGIAVDPEGGHIYWTQKGADKAGEGRILRAGIDLPAGEAPSARTDIEVLYADLPEPIDLDLDPVNRMLYWTDRGDPPRGNTVNRASMDIPPHSHAQSEILVTHLMEGIGLALDLKGGRMFVTDLAGSVYSANLDGTNKKTLLAAQGNLTGITYVEHPA
jgi:DNA-binding beta-propeller fold protein YncE